MSTIITTVISGFVSAVQAVYALLWHDLIAVPLPGGETLGLSLLVLLLVPTGVIFTIRTRCLPVRLLPAMLRVTLEKRSANGVSLSGVQSLIVSTATRVGMGNLVGVVAAISAGGAGAVFWMWVTALVGSATAFIEATLANIYKEKDPLYGGYRGGPALYIHALEEKWRKKKLRRSVIAVLFAVSGLICWASVALIVSNSVSTAFVNAFHIPSLASTVVLVALAAVIILRKNTTVKVLDIMVPIMAVCYFVITLFIIFKNFGQLPAVFTRIFQEAFGLRPIAGGTLGTVIINGVQRGLFSNEAGSGSAPCASAAADVSHPAKAGLVQSFGVFIDTIIICTCSAMIMLLAPESVTAGLEGMSLLQAAMQYHLGDFGVIFIFVILWLFGFSTFIGLLFYSRPITSYLFGDNWTSQTAVKVFMLIMLFMGDLATYNFVWQLNDISITLMTIINILIIVPISGQALKSLKEYEALRKEGKRP